VVAPVAGAFAAAGAGACGWFVRTGTRVSIFVVGRMGASLSRTRSS
jgi:hypothetical protein